MPTAERLSSVAVAAAAGIAGCRCVHPRTAEKTHEGEYDKQRDRHSQEYIVPCQPKHNHKDDAAN
jgi:hypothetical protein